MQYDEVRIQTHVCLIINLLLFPLYSWPFVRLGVGRWGEKTHRSFNYSLSLFTFLVVPRSLLSHIGRVPEFKDYSTWKYDIWFKLNVISDVIVEAGKKWLWWNRLSWVDLNTECSPFLYCRGELRCHTYIFRDQAWLWVGVVVFAPGNEVSD